LTELPTAHLLQLLYFFYKSGV